MKKWSGIYQPRHSAPLPGLPDLSAMRRARVDQDRAARAVLVLAATSGLPASRVLYRRLLVAGALHPALAVAS